MKKVLLLILTALLVIGLCSCKEPCHRKIVFEDGESHCFHGNYVLDGNYIEVGTFLRSSTTDTKYISLKDRHFAFTKCDCENINK